MIFHCKYSPQEDALVVYFIDPSHFTGPIYSRAAKTPYENDIFFDIDKRKKICSLEILLASHIVKKNQLHPK
jgi:uncharacterized protein YuzE